MKLWIDEQQGQLHIEPETLGESFEIGRLSDELQAFGVRVTERGVIVNFDDKGE